MYTAPPLLALALTLAATAPALAQCPDGTPPPCRQATAAPAAARGPVDENLIAIFPFRITGSSSDAASLREGAMDLLGLALDEQAGLRVVPSRTLLARAHSFSDATSVADAAALARSLGAGTMILGNAIVVGTQVRARAEVHDLVAGRPVGSVDARGMTADPGPVIDSLASGIARLRLASSGGSRRSLTEFATTSPAALRLYVASEQAARRGRWQEAADSLQRAIANDSSFALAYYRLRIAGTFGASINPWTPSGLVGRVLPLAERMPRRQRDLLVEVAATLRGSYRDAIQAADALGARYPDDAEAAYEQGEAYYHVGLAFGERPERALEAFNRALRNDSSFVDPYSHAVELRVVIGDTAGALALARRGAALAPASGVHQALLLGARAVAGHEEPAALAAEVRARGLDVGGGTDVVSRAGYECVRMLNDDPGRAMRLLEGFAVAGTAPDRGRSGRIAALVYLLASHAARGRWRDARADLDALQPLSGRNPFAAARLTIELLTGRDVDSALASMDFGSAGFQTLGMAGLGAVRTHRAPLLDSIVARIQAMATTDFSLGDFAPATAAALRGLDALARADTARAREQLVAAMGVLPYETSGSGRFMDPVAWAALALSDLERASGQLDAADRRLDYGVLYTGPVPLRAEMEEMRARIAEQRGDSATAIRSWRNVVSLWQDADPELQPRVSAARAALARIERR